MQPSRYALPAIAAALLAACGGKGGSGGAAAPDTSCTGCHGDAAAKNAAPPRSSKGVTATTDRAVGAHQAHLSSNAFRKAVACSECHPVPLTPGAAGHNDGKVDVVFGPLATSGATGASLPAWSGTTLTCSNVYCHGRTLSGGSNKSPRWTNVIGNPTDPRSEVACGTCHSIPPVQKAQGGGHPDIPAAYVDPINKTRSCNYCHPGTVDAAGALDLVAGLHIDGLIEIGARGCTQCHGDEARPAAALAPAPPCTVHAANAACPPGGTSTSLPGVGAHEVHLSGTRLRAQPLACTECHLIPTNLKAHPKGATTTHNGQVNLTWGPLARAAGASPAYDATTTPASPTCATTYCHGTTLTGGTVAAPVWTRLDGTQAACGACHGMPPNTAVHAAGTANPAPARCGDCHTGYGGTDLATWTVNAAVHIDGYINVGNKTCISCHGSGTGRPASLQPAPPTDTGQNTSTTAVGVGAHMSHLVAGTVSKPVACTECHHAEVSTEHAVGHTTRELVWGPLATTGGSFPAWNYDDATRAGPKTCSNTYCHGSTLGGGTAKEPIWTQVDGTQAACGTCHGIPPPAPHEPRPDCASCHAGYTATTVNLELHLNGLVEANGGSCSSCHGDPTRLPALAASAPPLALSRLDASGGASTALPAVGAHERHVTDGPLRRALACSECHPVVTNAGQVGSHQNGAVDVLFGPLARTGGAAAGYDSTTTPASPTCAASYCHGATLPGGTRTTPVWTRTDGYYMTCDACHGVPPADPPHAGLTAQSACAGCHAGYSATTVNLDLHVNGVVNVTGGGCGICHGDPARTPASAMAAPPFAVRRSDASGGTATTLPAVGAHLKHLTDGAISRAVACTECHATVTSSDATGTHRDGKADVVFGPLATTGSPAAAYDRTVPASPSCSATYCHGATLFGGTGTAPVWTRVDGSFSTCGSCHGNPPPASAGHVQNSACGSCHGAGYTNAAVDLALHMNGIIDVAGNSCTVCHGDGTRVPVAGADPLTPAAPPATALAGATAGAHLAHLNRGTLARPIACSECHAPVTSMDRVGTHRNGVADVAFGTLARSGGAAAAWDLPTLTCSATYCHGATLLGGTLKDPRWSSNSQVVACGTCHGIPPASAVHSGLTGTSNCGTCHTGYTASTVNVANHVNGVVDAAAMTCTSCHGDAARVLVTGADAAAKSAPPVHVLGKSGGAHLAHLNRGTFFAPIACAECHTVPASFGSPGHANGTADVLFGTRARTGGAVPTWTAATQTCAASYCHGSGFRSGKGANPITWGSTAALTCTSCHLAYPLDNCHPGTHATAFNNHDGGILCSSCHKNVNSTGTTITNKSTHGNGVINGKCVECHAGAAPGTSRNRICTP